MTTQSKKNLFAIIGAALDFPAFIIVTLGLTQVVVGETELHRAIYSFLTPQSLVIHPALVVGGILTAIVLNAPPVFNVRLQSLPDSVVTTIVTRWKSLNVGVLALSFFLMVNIFVYAFFENFRIVPR